MSRTNDLEKENEELKTRINQLESQIDSYRFGREIESWPPPVEIIREGLTGDIEKQKRELAELNVKIKLAQAQSVQKNGLAKEITDLLHQSSALKAEIHLLETKAIPLRGEYDLAGVMQLVKKLCQAYEFTNNIFRYRLGKSDDLTLSDVETLIRRAIRTK